MSMESAYSVVMCTFNGAEYVGEQIESILRQGQPPLEIVLSDDNSSDDTLAIVQHLINEHNRGADVTRPIELRVFADGVQRGPAQNFSRALAEARTPWVALSDQDDVWRVGRLPDLARIDPRITVVAGNARLVDHSGRPIGRSLFEELRVSDVEIDRLRSVSLALGAELKRNALAGATFIARRDFLITALPIPEGWMHDHWIATLAALFGGLEVTRRELIDYRQHSSNVVGAGRRSPLRLLSRLLLEESDSDALARKYRVLRDRVVLLGGVSPEALHLVDMKAAFEEARSQIPRRRLRRLRPILHLVAKGEYKRFSSNGNANALRDLVQRRPRRDAVDPRRGSLHD